MHLLPLVTGVLVFLLLTLSATLVACGLAVRSVLRANRVVPEHRGFAPTTWMWCWREPARLHRRLRRAVTLTRTSIAPLRPSGRGRRRDQAAHGLVAVADDLCQRAAYLDDQLAGAAAAAAPWRAASLGPLTGEVREVEATAWRLHSLVADWRRQLHEAGTAGLVPDLEIGARLDAFEAAMAELSGPQVDMSQLIPSSPASTIGNLEPARRS